MLRQKPLHVKLLANGAASADNVVRMSCRFNRVVLLATSLLVNALLWAQAADFDALRRKAEAGDAKAQFDLADAYSEGKGIARDSAKGMEWLKRSALQGFAGAQVVLGYMYQNGINMEKDSSEAAKWYKKAARQAERDPKHAQTAQNHLSEMLAAGLISASDADWHQDEPPAVTPPTTAKRTKPNQPSPFSLGEVETGLTGGITSKRMATLVSTYGVDFILNSSSRQRLSDEGADDSLLAAIASANR